MARNPFHFGGPVTGEHFTDRVDELKLLVTLMENGQNVVLLSPRRYGKSSLLERAIGEFRRRRGRAARVNLMRCSSRREVAQEIARVLGDITAGAVRRQAASVARALLSHVPSLTMSIAHDGVTYSYGLRTSAAEHDWGEDIAGIIRALHSLPTRSAGVCLVLDEFQRVAEIDGGFAGVFKAIVDECPGISLVFAGSRRHLMDRVFTGEGAPLLNVGQRISLAPIPAADMLAFLRQRFGSIGVLIDERTAMALYQHAHGIPYYVQHLGFLLVDTVDDQQGMLSPQSVLTALDRGVDMLESDFAESFDRLGSAQRRLLVVLAARGPTAHIYSEAVVREIGITSTGVRVAAEKLHDLELIERAEGRWRVVDPFRERWLSRAAP